MSNLIVCRKCGGNHLTIKCGKENENKIKDIIENQPIIQIKKNDESPVIKKFADAEERKNFYKKKLHKVKINQLPNDVTEEEMLELLYDWGDVGRIKVINYDDVSCVFAEFKGEDEANYIVEALHKTPFEHQIITVERLYD